MSNLDSMTSVPHVKVTGVSQPDAGVGRRPPACLGHYRSYVGLFGRCVLPTLFSSLLLMPEREFKPGQRVRVNENAVGLVAGFVGTIGHIGIGSLNTPSFYQGDYFVSVRLETGSTVILRLPERCLDEASAEFRL